MCTTTHVHKFTQKRIYIYKLYRYMCTPSHVHRHINVYTNFTRICEYMHIYVNLQINVYVHTCTCT